MKTAHKILIGQPEGKRSFGRLTVMCRWENNIKMDLKGRG
jgi:hypothetical protein